MDEKRLRELAGLNEGSNDFRNEIDFKIKNTAGFETKVNIAVQDERGGIGVRGAKPRELTRSIHISEITCFRCS